MKFIGDEPALTYDDVLLVPQYSDIASRSEVDTRTSLGWIDLEVPLIVANMDSIAGFKMALATNEAGGLTILHRYAQPDVCIGWLEQLKEKFAYAVPSVGVNELNLLELYREHTDAVCIDIAHGNSGGMVNAIRYAKSLKYTTIIAGNVCTYDGALRLAMAGANVIKVGVGPGSACETRVVAGSGVPQFSAILDCVRVKSVFPNAKIIADGGAKNLGDIAKAIGAGADAVMSGYFFKGCSEAENPNSYRGMASSSAQEEGRGKVNNRVPEGVSMSVEPTGVSAIDITKDAQAALRSAMSYSGARDIEQFQESALFTLVTGNAIVENGARK